VLVELDLATCLPLFPWLLPEGLFYRVLLRAPSQEQLTQAAAARTKVVRKLYASVGAQRAGTETRRQLLWLHFMDALYFASQGQPLLALDFASQGLQLQPREAELLRLVQLLRTSPDSFRLRDFLPRN